MHNMSFDVKYARERNKDVIFRCIHTLFANAGVVLTDAEFDAKLDKFDSRYRGNSGHSLDIYEMMALFEVDGKVVLFVYNGELYLLVPDLYDVL